MKVNFLLLLFLAIGLSETLFAQVSVMPESPTSTTIPNYNINPIIRATPPPITPFSNPGYYPSRQDIRHQEEILVAQQRRAQMIMDEATEFVRRKKIVNELITNGFPSLTHIPGAEHFLAAFDELSNMLTDSIPMDLCRAVYLIENACYGGSQDYEEFRKLLNERVKLCDWRLQELKLNPKDNLALNMVIYSLLCDTLTIKQPGTEKGIINYPLKYNIDDYMSQKDFTSHFVTTLLKSNTGQCHSMPLLYMLIAEKLGAEASIAYAPHHSFIKIQDEKGAWYNLELTCRYILSDNHYMNHSYIKSEAIRNKVYLSPLTKKELIASLTAQLGAYYQHIYGYDSFSIQCAEMSGAYYPNCTQALLLKADYQTRLTLEIARLLGVPNPEVLKATSPEAYLHYEKMNQLYKEVDDSGYEATPPEVYARWYKHVVAEKEKTDNP